jgi:hypothetical protein
MSKKSKRQSRKRSTLIMQENNNSSSKTTSYEFNPDYSETIKDLKRIGILAVTFFGVLIALSFFLR